MPMGTRSVVVVVVVLLALAGPTVGATAAFSADAPDQADLTDATDLTDPADISAPASTALTTDGNIHLTTRLALTPERPGEIGVTLRFRVPDRVADLETTIAPGAKRVETNGFAPTEGDTYVWDGDTATPTISYRLPANQTAAAGRFAGQTAGASADGTSANRRATADAGSVPADAATVPADAATGSGTTAAEEQYLFVDAGPWALVAAPSPGLSWRYRGETVGVTRETTTAGPGAVGGRMVFLGDHTIRERTAHGQTFRLVIPEMSVESMTVSPDAVLDSYADASDTLRVGDRDESVFVVAAPTGVEWAVRGLQTGDADAWVRADEPLNTAESPWIHEYVHTRQSYATTDETRWTVEGSADYYAATLALDQERIGFREFADHLARGTRDPHVDAVLADPGTWASGTQYRKGSLVTGELDRRIRLASGGGATFGTVLARLNAEDDPITGERLRTHVAGAGNESVGDVADRYTRTDATPEVWNAERHEAAFGTLAARIVVTPPATVEASGPYRNTTLAPPATVAVGETVAVLVPVANGGGAAGDYRVALAVDNRTVDATNGTLDAGTNATVPLSWTTAEPGTYELTVRGLSYEVRVREPSAPRVASLSADRTVAQTGESVLFTAEVVADGDVPADGDVSVRVDGEPVATERVRVDPEGSATLQIPVAFDDPGQRTVSVGNRTLTITVEEPPWTTEGTEDRTSTRMPGFGIGATAATLLLAVAALAGIRRLRSER